MFLSTSLFHYIFVYSHRHNNASCPTTMTTQNLYFKLQTPFCLPLFVCLLTAFVGVSVYSQAYFFLLAKANLHRLLLGFFLILFPHSYLFQFFGLLPFACLLNIICKTFLGSACFICSVEQENDHASRHFQSTVSLECSYFISFFHGEFFPPLGLPEMYSYCFFYFIFACSIHPCFYEFFLLAKKIENLNYSMAL